MDWLKWLRAQKAPLRKRSEYLNAAWLRSFYLASLRGMMVALTTGTTGGQPGTDHGFWQHAPLRNRGLSPIVLFRMTEVSAILVDPDKALYRD